MNIKTGTVFKRYLILITTTNELIEYDLVDHKINTLNISDYFKNLNFDFEHIFYMNNYFLFFNKDIYYKYDLNTNKFIESDKIKHIFKIYPKNFSAVF